MVASELEQGGGMCKSIMLPGHSVQVLPLQLGQSTNHEGIRLADVLEPNNGLFHSTLKAEVVISLTV
jgi:hypothetical protein